MCKRQTVRLVFVAGTLARAKVFVRPLILGSSSEITLNKPL
jgi:hypothetical protein